MLYNLLVLYARFSIYRVTPKILNTALPLRVYVCTCVGFECTCLCDLSLSLSPPSFPFSVITGESKTGELREIRSRCNRASTDGRYFSSALRENVMTFNCSTGNKKKTTKKEKQHSLYVCKHARMQKGICEFVNNFCDPLRTRFRDASSFR